MANNLFVMKSRKILHVKPFTTVGSLFGKNQKEKKTVKAKLRRILHLGRKVYPRDLLPSKSLIQIATVDPEPAGRIAFDLCREVMTSENINLSTKQSDKAKISPGDEVDPLGETLAQAIAAYNRPPVPSQSHNLGLLRHRVNEGRRLIAVNYPIGPIPQSPRGQGPTRLAATYPVPQLMLKMLKVRVPASPDHESEKTEDMIEFSTTPAGSPFTSKNRQTSTPIRHMVDENGNTVTDGHQFFATFRADTLMDRVLSRSYRLESISGSLKDEVDWADVSSGTVDTCDMSTQSSTELEPSDAFWNPREPSALARKGVGKPPGGLWEKLTAAKRGVDLSSDRHSASKYELLLADQVRDAKKDSESFLGQSFVAQHQSPSPSDEALCTKYDLVFATLVQAEKNKLKNNLSQDSNPTYNPEYLDLKARIASLTPRIATQPANKDGDDFADGIWLRKPAQLAPKLEGLSSDQFQSARLEMLNFMNQAPKAKSKTFTTARPNLKAGTSAAYATPKETRKSVGEGGDDPSRLLLRRLASTYKMTKDEMLKSPEQDLFRDSGYVTPFKSDDGSPMDLRGPDTKQELVPPRTPKLEPEATEYSSSLVRTSSRPSSLDVESLSLNEIDNLTIEFANRASEHLDLGLDYMVEQSNLELQAQRRDRRKAYANQIPVNISDILTRAAIMRPHLQGTPAFVRTRDFETPAAAIEVDDCVYLNLPEKGKICVLRIGVGKNGRVAYYLNLMILVRGFDSTMEAMTIVSQMDVTSVVQKLALQEFHARSKLAKPAKPLEFEGNIWIEQAKIEEAFDEALSEPEKKAEELLDSPSPQIRRLLAFFLKLGSEHQECAVFAGEKPPGWDNIHWQTYYVTRDVRENEDDDNLMYEKKIDEYMWSQIQYKLDDGWERFRWRETISWGKDGEQRGAYFIPMADGWSIGEKERKKWWLMFLSDFDEDAWAKERFV